MEEFKTLAQNKLAECGLSIATSERLGMSILTAEETARLWFGSPKLESIKINYYDPNGVQYLDLNTKSLFCRLRLFNPDSKNLEEPEKRYPKYIQPSNTIPCAYFPRIVNWREISNNYKQDIIITEGEFKAAKACLHGFNTIGLGGVYSFRSLKHGIELIPSLTDIKWKKRKVFIIFDSDLVRNPNVGSAVNQLSDVLTDRGAITHFTLLPEVGMTKVGLDDFMVECENSGDRDFSALRNLLDNSPTFGFSRTLWKMNDNFVAISSPPIIYNLNTGNKMSYGTFKDYDQKNATAVEARVLKNGAVKRMVVPAAPLWLKWGCRNSAEAITYQPGKERLINQDGHILLNVWKQYKTTPKKGDVSLFKRLLSHIFEGADHGAMQWFLQWLAYPLKYPGTKLYTAVLIHGRLEGTGKTLIAYTMREIYGDNFNEINQMDLFSQFNAWAENKQFVLADDISGGGQDRTTDILKKLITQKEILINEKHVKVFPIPDCINYFFTSNHPDTLKLGDNDRRFFIHEVKSAPMPQEFYLEYDQWYQNGGASAVHHYLLNDVDLTDFNPKASAMKTTAKEVLISITQSECAIWLRQLLDYPDGVLVHGVHYLTRDVYSAKELLLLFIASEGSTKISIRSFSNELRRAGFPLVNKGVPLRVKNKPQARYYAVRNIKLWENAPGTDIARHIENEDFSSAYSQKDEFDLY